MLSRIAAHIRGSVVGYIALVLALSGTAYAAGKINGKQIKPNSIPGNRIRNGSLTGKQVNSSALGTVPNAAAGALAIRSSVRSRIIDTNASCVPGVAARAK